jgi:hypothetical protein
MAVFNDPAEDKWSAVSFTFVFHPAEHELRFVYFTFVFLLLVVQNLRMLSIEIVKAKEKPDFHFVP